MKEYKSQLVRYVVGDCDKEIDLNLASGVWSLVLVAHDEMTAQCNDGEKMSWIWQGELNSHSKKKVLDVVYTSQRSYAQPLVI